MIKDIPKNKKNKNKRVVKENAPYNVCDRFCERCDYQKKCKLRQDANAAQIKNAVEGRSPYYVKNIFDDLEKSFTQIKETLKKVAKEEGIDINNVSKGKESRGNYLNAELSIKKDPLYKISSKFVKNADVFLKKLFLFSQKNNPFLLPALNEDINNLFFYFDALLSKVHRALLYIYDSELTGSRKYIEANYSICIAFNASMVCEKSIGNITREVPEFFVEYLELITMLREIRDNIKKIFPEAEDFQNDIIFNTPLH